MDNKYLRKIYILVVIILIIVSLNFLLNLFSRVNVSKKEETKTNNTTQDESNSYDVSMMNSVTIEELVKLFNNKKDTYVVYLGRENCSVCVSFLPTLQDMQNKYNYITQYLDIRTVDTSSEAFKTFKEKLSKKITIHVNNSSETDSYGNYFGYTPMVFIINKGNFTDGIVGAYSKSEFEEFLNKNGIK